MPPKSAKLALGDELWNRDISVVMTAGSTEAIRLILDHEQRTVQQGSGIKKRDAVERKNRGLVTG